MLRAFKVSGSSMEPTLRTDDIVVVLKKKNISVNDIVVVEDSEYGFLIKRLEKFEKNGIKLSSDNKNSFSPTTNNIYDISNIVDTDKERHIEKNENEPILIID